MCQKAEQPISTFLETHSHWLFPPPDLKYGPGHQLVCDGLFMFIFHLPETLRRKLVDMSVYQYMTVGAKQYEVLVTVDIAGCSGGSPRTIWEPSDDMALLSNYCLNISFAFRLLHEA